MVMTRIGRFKAKQRRRRQMIEEAKYLALLVSLACEVIFAEDFSVMICGMVSLTWALIS